jgi:hypothetical protein
MFIRQDGGARSYVDRIISHNVIDGRVEVMGTHARWSRKRCGLGLSSNCGSDTLTLRVTRVTCAGVRESKLGLFNESCNIFGEGLRAGFNAGCLGCIVERGKT